MSSYPRTAEQPQCPQCGAHLVRVRRNVLDRLLSVVRPVRRYRCRKAGCGWEGTLRDRAAKD